MYKFTAKSRENLLTVHPFLRAVLESVITMYDFSILEGLRDKETQNKYYEQNKTQLKYPNSKHNRSLLLDSDTISDAVDIAPYPIDWNDLNRFYYLAGLMKGTFARLRNTILIPGDIELVWGGDWDNDNDFSDNSFNDLVHYELRRKE